MTIAARRPRRPSRPAAGQRCAATRGATPRTSRAAGLASRGPGEPWVLRTAALRTAALRTAEDALEAGLRIRCCIDAGCQCRRRRMPSAALVRSATVRIRKTPCRGSKRPRPSRSVEARARGALDRRNSSALRPRHVFQNDSVPTRRGSQPGGSPPRGLGECRHESTLTWGSRKGRGRAGRAKVATLPAERGRRCLNLETPASRRLQKGKVCKTESC